MMERILCLDYGDARIGVALTDPLQMIVSAHSTIPTQENALERIYKICDEKKVGTIVIGMPYGKEGEIGPAAEKVLHFAKLLHNTLLSHNFIIEYYWQDERYTTREAADTMKSIHVRKKRRKAVVDQIAACNILKEFLNSRYKEKITFDSL